MKTIGSFDAKTHLSKILEEVSKGENYVITKHGKPIAEISPVTKKEEFNWEEQKEYFRQMRKKFSKERNISIDEILKWRDEGRA